MKYSKATFDELIRLQDTGTVLLSYEQPVRMICKIKRDTRMFHKQAFRP